MAVYELHSELDGSLGGYVWQCDECKAFSSAHHGWTDAPKDWLWRWSLDHKPYNYEPTSFRGIADQYTLRHYHRSFQFCCNEHLTTYIIRTDQQFLERDGEISA